MHNTHFHSAIRFVLPKSVVQDNIIISSVVEDDVYMFSWKGNDKRILVYPVDYDRHFKVTCTYPSHLSDQQTSNNHSAAVVGMNTLALDLLLKFLISAYSSYSLQ